MDEQQDEEENVAWRFDTYDIFEQPSRKKVFRCENIRKEHDEKQLEISTDHKGIYALASNLWFTMVAMLRGIH